MGIRGWCRQGIALLSAALLLLAAGCETGDSTNFSPNSSYPPPDSGHVAVVQIDHRLFENNRDPRTTASVQVLVNGNPSLNATVTFNGQQLDFDSRERAFYDVITPSLIPGGSARVRIRSSSWGEDSTAVFLPGAFDLEGSSIDTVWLPGMVYTFRWESSLRAKRFIVRINIADSANALVQDTLAATDTTYAWTIPEQAADNVVRVRVTAEREVTDAPVWEGKAQSWHDFALQLGPGKR